MLVRLLAALFTSAPLGAPSTVTLSDDSSNSDGARYAGVSFTSAGVYSKYISGALISSGHWLSPVADIDQYEIRATLSSGDTPTGTIGSWEALTTTRTWTLSTTTLDNTDSCVLLIEIRWTGNNVVQDSASYTLTALGPVTGGNYPGLGGNEHVD